ncbi:MAG: hypothetical protein U9Q93_15645 [Pseudomonadota bacterium]|jgi:hypothetical protein|nr:hypothetical protein [Alcanivorax sp.]MEA3261478.1 hypothetical protein [Pseudomonadota bacterium]|tara:strand:+ start:16389 stop:17756 length:1368 start_codon:yes stop_codon:yes gene_type:complete
MIGEAMKLIAGAALLTLVAAPALAQPVEYTLPDADALASAPSMMGTLSEYRDQLGWSDNLVRRADGSSLYVFNGIAMIAAPVGSPAFMTSRQNAFDKAMLQAKKAMAEYMAVEIGGELEAIYSEPSQARQEMEAARRREEGLQLEASGRMANDAADEIAADSNSLTLTSAAEETRVLLQRRIDARLRELGYDPDQPVDQQVLKKITSDAGFRKQTRTLAEQRVVGLQPLRVFEQVEAGGPRELGVVAVWSPKLNATAHAIYSGDGVRLPKAENAGKSFQAQIPEDEAVLMSTFGARQVIGPEGQYAVMSFAQAAPRAKSTRSLQAAYNKAKQAASFGIRQFAGEIALAETRLDTRESTTTYDDGTAVTEYDESYQERIHAQAKTLSISGLRVLKNWQARHPATGQLVVGTVMLWTPDSGANARALERSIRDPNAGEPASGQGFRGAGQEADLDAF